MASVDHRSSGRLQSRPVYRRGMARHDASNNMIRLACLHVLTFIGQAYELSTQSPSAASPHGIYDISMQHQLHCLTATRTQLLTIEFAIKHGTTDTRKAPLDHGMLHIGHCLEYLRQGILCAADLTLEPLTEASVSDGAHAICYF